MAPDSLTPNFITAAATDSLLSGRISLASESRPSLSPTQISPTQASHTHVNHSRVKQNWVLDPLQDSLLIIAAPIFTLVLALASIYFLGVVKGATLVLVSHVVFTVAHHLPTFIRIYGDVELFRRYRWHFVFAPLISLSICMAVLIYINTKSYPLDSFLYLYILLTLWDPWHFMRQHYGFMRIYDRHNAAPKRVSSRMDLALSITWFAYIMAASGDWLLDLLQDMYTRVHWPLLLSLSSDGLSTLTSTLRMMALLSTGIYVGYLIWCRKQGYFVSMAKVLMCVTTFGVMYLTYTPNSLIQSLAPGWSFKVGFAVIGIVHMTQYLAIVWRYNRGLATRQSRARSGVFRWLHSRGAWWAAGIYIFLCLAYGDVVTTVHDNEWLMAALLAIGFTSTMMHYYFDGFIWKIRHQQNQEALNADTTSGGSESVLIATSSDTQSWWSSFKTASPLQVVAKQLLYFAVPMAVLTAAAMLVWGYAPGDYGAHDNYVEHMYQAQALNTRGLGDQAAQEARIAFAAMQAQLPLTQKLVELQPTAARQAEFAFLIYNESLYENIVMPALAGQASSTERLINHRSNVQLAIQQLNAALDRGGSLAHTGRENITVEDAIRILTSWRKQVG
jgi:hypothetical protein